MTTETGREPTAVPRVALTGRPGCGKTTAVVRTVGLVQQRGLSVGGFYTEEVRRRGRRVGFDVVLVNPGGGGRDRAPLARVGLDSPVQVSRYGVDVTAVADHALPAVETPADVVVIDEVAPMELACRGFAETVERVLDRDQPLLLTLHARGGSFIRRLTARPEVTVTTVTPDNRDELPCRLADLFTGGVHRG